MTHFSCEGILHNTELMSDGFRTEDYGDEVAIVITIFKGHN